MSQPGRTMAAAKYRLRAAKFVVTLRRFFQGGLVAQLVEQCPFKALVQGSSPCQPTIFQNAKRKMQNDESRIMTTPRVFPHFDFSGILNTSRQPIVQWLAV